MHKSLAVQLAGASCRAIAYTLHARVPTGGTATVRLPIGASAPASVSVSESGAIVWRKGVFAPAPGIYNASASGDGYIAFATGSGTFDFAIEMAVADEAAFSSS